MMDLKKVIPGMILAMAASMSMAGAEGNIWMDENAEVQANQFKKVILFPIENATSDESSMYNNMLHKRANKRIKKTNFLGFSKVFTEEQKHILREPKYQALDRHFNSENERYQAVKELTAADGYLIPRLRWEKERIDHSPATWTNVKMVSYYNEKNGPNGNRDKLGYRSWWQSHLIPAADLPLRMIDMDFVLYDGYTGKKAMTMIDYYRCYGKSKEHAFNIITKNFTGDWNRLKRDKPQNVSENAPTMGFRNLSLPASVANDEFAIKTIYYAFKDEAGDRLKRVKVDYSPNGGRYYVTGQVTRYQRGETWIPPQASTVQVFDRSEKFTWKDKDGNEHEGRREYYKTSIVDHSGYNTFWYRVGMNLRLVDSQTGRTVLTKSATAEDSERYGNALREILKDFYKEVDNSIGCAIK